MSNDPLDVVFVTGDESALLKRADTARKLATYIQRMPVELRGMFTDEFQHINRAELAQFHAELSSEKLRADTLSAARNVLAAQLEAAQARCASQAAQLEQARKAMECARITLYEGSSAKMFLDDWLTANAQPQEQSA